MLQHLYIFQDASNSYTFFVKKKYKAAKVTERQETHIYPLQDLCLVEADDEEFKY